MDLSHLPSGGEGVMIIGLMVGGAIVIALICAVSSTLNAMKNANLKHAMIMQRMSPEAIVQVIAAQPGNAAATHVDGATSLRCACEAVVEGDGEWHAALVLKEAEGQYFVHFIGTGMDENEWVGEDRIRFARDSHFVSQNGMPRKEPMEAEL
jgi:hypothetical protein